MLVLSTARGWHQSGRARLPNRMATVAGQQYSVMQARRVPPLVKFNISTLNNPPGHRGIAKMHADVNSSPLLPLHPDNVGYEADTEKRDLILTKQR